jgi:hypothetical protein
MEQTTRRATEVVFNQLYERIGNLGDPCVYCGVESCGWDHVPPLHFVSRLSAEVRNRYSFRLLPACSECNHCLGGTVKTTISERRTHVRRHLKRKYAGLLRIPHWDNLELHQVSANLQTDIQSRLRAAAFVRQRLQFHSPHHFGE